MKNKVNIYLCDDNHAFIDITEARIKDILASQQRPYELFTFSTAKTLVEAFSLRKADVVFLDIDMPHMTGFEAAEELQKIKPSVNIIFITSHEDKVFQSYEFHPFWFVRKSHLEDLNIVLTRLLVKIDTDYNNRNGCINLICNNKTVEIDINKVKTVSAYDHYILVKDIDNKEIQLRCRISDIERQLYKHSFIRIQNGIIVNCRFISKMNSRMVILHDGETINIGRDRVEYAKSEFQKFMRSI